MTEEPSSPKRVRIDPMDLEDMSRDELINKLRDQDKYVRYLEDKTRSRKSLGDDDAEADDKLKQHQKEAVRRENTLVHRLTTKEQELQDYINQIQEMKQAQTQNTAQLRSMLLDPAVNHVFQRMSKEMDESREKLKQTQNELSAWKFTPDSQTGKRLMAKCRMLLQENEELGKVIASGRTAKLEGEIALQKTLVQEMKTNQTELDEFLGDLEEDVEGMQSMIYVLQQQLKETKEQVLELQNENKDLRNKRTTLENDPETKSPHRSQLSSSSPNRPSSQIKEERTDSSQGFYKTCDAIETSSEPEMMETDQDPTDTSQSCISGSEVNHITPSHHNKASNQSVSKLKKDNYYDSTDDLSNDPWSSPLQQNTEELVNRKDTLERETTPELDKPSDKDLKTDLLQNGINRTKTEIKEEIDDV